METLLVAGDVYDRAVPPRQAVDLLDEVLFGLVLGLGIQVFLIAGNHDGPERLEFGHQLLARQGLYIFGEPTARIGWVNSRKPPSRRRRRLRQPCRRRTPRDGGTPAVSAPAGGRVGAAAD